MFCKKPYISGTLGATMFKLLRYLQGRLSMIPIKFCEDMSNHLNEIALYDKIQNGA